MTDSALAMARLAEHLERLARMLVDASGTLPDGDAWVKISGVALELTRLAGQFGAASESSAS